MKTFLVFLNGKLIGETDGRSLASAKRWVKRNVRDTHMGEWIKRNNGFEYATTIGQYYTFSLAED